MEDTGPSSKVDESEDEWEVEPGIRIVGVCGSLRESGATRSGLAIALEGAAKFGVDTRLIELRDYELPFCGATSEEDYPADVARLRNELQDSHGIILGTPEYHGSMSGVLKNTTLDIFIEFSVKKYTRLTMKLLV